MHPIDCNGKCFTKIELIHANNAAINEKRNRQFREDYLENLPDDALFPIIRAFDEHNKGEIRVQIFLDEKGTTGFLDLSRRRYDLLPRAIFREDGTVELIRTNKDPYPQDREYEEKVHRKLVRDKDFRKNVLSAYDKQCAMCEINDSSLLVAAHIYPAQLCGDDTVNNGICLCSNHDKAYERGIICIKPDGEIIIHNKVIDVSYEKIRFPIDKESYPSPERLGQRFQKSMKRLGLDDCN